jgi:hypothetical protein
MKVAHLTWWRAAWHAFRVNWQTGERRDGLKPYACQWGENYRDGQTATRHWHVGHSGRDDMWGY